MNITIIIYLVAIAVSMITCSVIMMLYHTIFNKSSVNMVLMICTMGVFLFSLFLYWM